mgnify:CR=1 FL=1
MEFLGIGYQEILLILVLLLVVVGPSPLHGEEMISPDIRAGVALLIAALCAEGTSIIRNVGQIDRGYERMEQRLRSLGARIERVNE